MAVGFQVCQCAAEAASVVPNGQVYQASRVTSKCDGAPRAR